MDTLTINAVAFEEGDVWVVQGIELDICTHAKDAAGVPVAFMRALAENVCIAQQLGRKPLEGIKPAPQRYKDMFDEAVTQVSPVRKDGNEIPNLPISEMNIRLAEHA